MKYIVRVLRWSLASPLSPDKFTYSPIQWTCLTVSLCQSWLKTASPHIHLSKAFDIELDSKALKKRNTLHFPWLSAESPFEKQHMEMPN